MSAWKIHIWSLRSIIGICWQDRITNTEVLTNLASQLLKQWLCKHSYVGPAMSLVLMSPKLPCSSPMTFLFMDREMGVLTKKRYKDCIKDHLQHYGIAHNTLKACVSNRIYWHRTIWKAFSSSVSIHWNHLINAREIRENSPAYFHPDIPVSQLCPCVWLTHWTCESHMNLQDLSMHNPPLWTTKGHHLICMQFCGMKYAVLFTYAAR